MVASSDINRGLPEAQAVILSLRLPGLSWMRSDREKHAHEDGITLAFLELLSNNQDFMLSHWPTEGLQMNPRKQRLSCVFKK